MTERCSRPIKLDLKRKHYSKRKQKFKRFKRTPKYIKDNVENKIAKEKEKDEYHFTDSEEDNADDLGMGLELSDLPFLLDTQDDNKREQIALTQDSVRPLFSCEDDYDETKLNEGLLELKYNSFRPNQKETIKRILMGRSTLFISSTGSGKSLCYQLPALLYWRFKKYMTIVVSPLISLMEDQMSNFPKSIKAVSLHSNHSLAQRRNFIKQLVDGDAQVAFISPEAIVGGLLNLDDLKNLPPIGFVCVDEAHCLSEWSHNFRPAYLQFFKVLHENMKIKTYLGLTATATKATSFAISKSLIINPETDVIGTTTIPDNLMLSVSYEANKEVALINLLKSPTFRIMTSIVVYCNRREDTEKVASRIRTGMQSFATLVELPERKRRESTSKDDSIKSNDSNTSNSSENNRSMKLTWHAEAYHAGLSTECRKRIQRQFIKGEIRVVVATIAFGMGINKSNIRAIIHYDMPSSFESYVQEIGRAGRDGKVAQCHMFLRADKTDLYYQQRNIYASITERMYLKKLTEFIFKKCSKMCLSIENAALDEKLSKLNQIDPHIIKSEHKTDFIQKAIQDDDSDDEEIPLSNDLNDSNGKENNSNNISGSSSSSSGSNHNSPRKYMRQSVVRKHRRCPSHDKTFSIEEVTEATNLKVESIITLMCQLQKAYPQLKLVQYTPVKSTCNLFCYKGPEQMEALAKTNKIVENALRFYRRNQIKAYGSPGETPTKLTFDVIEIASSLGLTYQEAIRMLRKTEWRLVEKTGKFCRSQVRVTFEGNSFHIKSVGDLNEEETEEINNFLFDFTKLYEKIEREKITKVFNTFKMHSINVDQMGEKSIRIQVSNDLKADLNTYFDRSKIIEKNYENDTHQKSSPTKIVQLSETKCDNSDVELIMSKTKIDTIRKNARLFISAHNDEFTPRSIARIFQGISTPKYSAELWGMNKRWWRIHTDVDFLKLTELIHQEMADIKKTKRETSPERNSKTILSPTKTPANLNTTNM